MKFIFSAIIFLCGLHLMSQNAPVTYHVFEYRNQAGCRFDREVQSWNGNQFSFGIESPICPQKRIPGDYWHSGRAMTFLYNKNSLTLIFGLNAPFLVYRDDEGTYVDMNFKQENVNSYYLEENVKYPVHVIQLQRRKPAKSSSKDMRLPILSRIRLKPRLKSLWMHRRLNASLRIHYCPRIGFVKLEYYHRGKRPFRIEELTSIDGEELNLFISQQKCILQDL